MHVFFPQGHHRSVPRDKGAVLNTGEEGRDGCSKEGEKEREIAMSHKQSGRSSSNSASVTIKGINTFIEFFILHFNIFFFKYAIKKIVRQWQACQVCVTFGISQISLEYFFLWLMIIFILHSVKRCIPKMSFHDIFSSER